MKELAILIFLPFILFLYPFLLPYFLIFLDRDDDVDWKISDRKPLLYNLKWILIFYPLLAIACCTAGILCIGLGIGPGILY